MASQSVFPKALGIKETPVFRTYWEFAAKRQDIFFRRIAGKPWPWTNDSILQTYKFTNAYRASDRVSQYLIRHVIYSETMSPEDMFLRIMLFKLFNKIETWELLTSHFGSISAKTFSVPKFDRVLSKAMEQGAAIYSAAYIMAPPVGLATKRKHLAHLLLVKRMLEDDLPHQISQAKSMESIFNTLLSYPMIGKFLAYQLATDFNYSELSNHSEMEFTVAGPGARDGIRKCFTDLGGRTEGDIIKAVADIQGDAFARLGIDFKSLGKRPLQLIDIQNLFCEVDKYSRVRHPEAKGVSGRTRIKQKFRINQQQLQPWYPPKWDIRLQPQLEETAK